MKLYAFAPIELTPETLRAIIELADQRIVEVMHQSESFRAQNRRISRREWKLVHTNEELNAYRRQQPSPARTRLHSNTTAVLEDSCGSPSYQWTREPEFVCTQNDDLDEVCASSDAISILLTGIQSGCIEDFALGSLAATESMTRLRHVHVDDDFEDVRVLATIHAPTEDDPFRYLGIKWMMRDLGPFLKRRDFVYLEATGLTFDTHGKQVSYQLRHSIELPHAPDLSKFGIIRGEISTCIIATQYDSANIEIYGRGLGEPHGTVSSKHVASRYASDVASVAGIADCAFSKKALWVMRQPYARKLTPASLKDCQLCAKRFNVIEKITHASVTCQICRQVRPA